MAHIPCDYSVHHPFNENEVTIRSAKETDVERITALCEQLGYRVSQEEVLHRLKQIKKDDNHAFYIAELIGENMVGWIHVRTRPSMVLNSTAEIAGLVVEEDYRDLCIGRFLMLRAEQWAHDKGCKLIRISSNINREGIELFYERLGYNELKISRVFQKQLKLK